MSFWLLEGEKWCFYFGSYRKPVLQKRPDSRPTQTEAIAMKGKIFCWNSCSIVVLVPSDDAKSPNKP